METFRRDPADSSIDRLASLRAGATKRTFSHSEPNKFRLIALIFSLALVGGGVLVAMRVAGGKDIQPSSEEQSQPSDQLSLSAELLSGESLVAFPVKRGNFPPSITRGDTIRIVVTPGPDGNGDISIMDEEVVVFDIGEMSDMSGDIVLTVRGSETVLRSIAASGPIHVARINATGASQ